LAATRGYGVKLYFSRAKDFGFSKTPEETEKVWGEQVLEDMVRVIRSFRPNVVINNWGGVHSGHGHHQAAGLLTPKAVQLAADPSQGIAGFLGSPFLRRPVALKREDGGELNPAILAQPLGPLDEDYEEANMGVDPLMRAVDSALVEARDAALRLDWKAATS